MDLNDKKTRILEMLDLCLKHSLKRVHFAWALPIPEGFVPHPYFRISFEMNSSMQLRAAFDGRIEEREIKNNEAVFFRQFAWDDIISAQTKKSLAIVFRPDFIRIVVGDDDLTLHNPYSLSTTGLYAVKLLDSLAAQKCSDQTLCCDAARLLLNITKNDFSLPLQGDSHAFQTFMSIKLFVSNNFEKQINRESTAEHFSLNPCYISQLFKKYSDVSFRDYLINLRLEKVHYLLNNTKMTISEITQRSGFSSDVRLIKSFRQHYGTSPARYRLTKKHRASFS